jgi:signal transduction histidine kinase
VKKDKSENQKRKFRRGLRGWDHKSWHDRAPMHHWDHKPPRWPVSSRVHRGKFFLRFLGMFSVIVVLVLGGMAAFAFILSNLVDGRGQLAALVWVLGCGLSLALPLLAGGVALSVFRGVATPIADIMSAADDISEGDFSVRVPEPDHGPGEFRRLAVSFNRMTAELERLDRQRRNLTADVAHELRTPLHIIQGNLEGIIDGVYEPTADQINVLLDEIRLLTRLVEDLGLLTMVETGQLTLKVESVDIVELLADVRTSFSGQMDAAGVDLRVDVPGDAGGLTIQADPERLDQIISNLVANALRHTPGGGVITLAAKPEQDGIQILVEDSGEGIPDEDLPYIFDRFWKGDRSRSRIGGVGSGLGLTISRNLVRAHGGTIAVDSKIGVGTTFTIWLPRG